MELSSHKSLASRKLRIVLFILVNLITSNFLVSLLPPNLFQFAVAMWSPAIFAVLFSIFFGDPLKDTLGLSKSKWSAYFLASLFPVLVGILTAVIGLLPGYLTLSETWTFKPFNAIPTLIIWVIAALGEELGWRGYLHTTMKGFQHAPLYIGLVWALWHFSQIISESGITYAAAVFTPTVILISYLLSTLREYGKSIWPCALYHGVWNFLRLKILFESSANNTAGMFSTRAYQITDMEGVFGFAALVVFSIPVILYWYKNISAPHNQPQEIPAN